MAQRHHRTALFSIGALLLSSLIAGGALTCFKRWVPVHGKARLIQWAEARWPLRIQLESLTWDPLRGFNFQELRMVHRDSLQLLVHIPAGHTDMQWLASLVQRGLTFQSTVTMKHPALARVKARTILRPKNTIILEVKTDHPLQRSDFSPPWQAYLPPSWQAGRIHPDLIATLVPQQPWQISGTLHSEGLKLSQPHITEGRATLSLALYIDPRTWPHWQGSSHLLIEHARVHRAQQPAMVLTQGSVSIQPTTWEVHSLKVSYNQTDWWVAGEFEQRGPAILSSLSILHPGFNLQHLHIPELPLTVQGTMELEMHCNGKAWEHLLADCRGRAQLHGARAPLQPPALELEAITGTLLFDLFAQQYHLQNIQATWQSLPLQAAGTIHLRSPSPLNVVLNAETALTALPLPQAVHAFFKPTHGRARIQAEVRGALAAPQWQAQITLAHAAGTVAFLAQPLEALTGQLTYAAGTVTASNLALRLGSDDLMLSGSLGLQGPHALNAQLTTPQGRWSLLGKAIPHQGLELTALEWSNGDESLHAAGQLAYPLEKPSYLTVDGSLHLRPNHPLRWIRETLPALPQPWQARVQLSGAFNGPLAQWQSAEGHWKALVYQLSYGELIVSEAELKLVLQNQRYWLEINRALVEPGTLSLKLHKGVDPADTTWLLETRAQNIPLHRLQYLTKDLEAPLRSGVVAWDIQLKGAPRFDQWQGAGWLRAESNNLGSMPLLNRLFGQGILGAFADGLGLEELRRARVTGLALSAQLHRGKLHTKDLVIQGTSAGDYVAIMAAGIVGLDKGLDSPIDLYLDSPQIQASLAPQRPSSFLKASVLRGAGLLDRLRRQFGYVRLTGTLRQPQRTFELSPGPLIEQVLPFEEVS
jgi:hypothetical protein